MFASSNAGFVYSCTIPSPFLTFWVKSSSPYNVADLGHVLGGGADQTHMKRTGAQEVTNTGK